ncbi:hypothetical protein [Thalassobacillus hwangdonensis]|uniref:DUF3139 domain-containing protein n=1 Tax=Thalassobacillus hwangdonensis TaxID=546108 RepID=A0ABW3L0R1_9BACI
MSLKHKTLKEWVGFLVFSVILVGGFIYYHLGFTPKDSLELYQQMHFADGYEEVQELVLEGYEEHINEEDIDYIQSYSLDRGISQFTLFEYSDRSYVVMTSPGTARLKVLAVEELPEDVRNFFMDLP